MRMDITKALARRLAQGDINIQNDGDKSYVAYDRVTAEVVGRRLHFSLWQGGVKLASADVEFRERGTVASLAEIEGRMELKLNPGTASWDPRTLDKFRI